MVVLTPFERIRQMRNELAVALINKSAMQRAPSVQGRDLATDRYVRAVDQVIEHLAVLNETRVLDVIEQMVTDGLGGERS